MTGTATSPRPRLRPAGPDWCEQHKRAASECRDKTHTYSIRQAGGLMDSVYARIKEEHLAAGEWMASAFRLRLGQDGCTSCRQYALRATGAEAELAAVRRELERIKRAVGDTAAPAGPQRDPGDLFAEALAKATPQSPVTPKDLMRICGRTHQWVHPRLAALTEAGYITRPDTGMYAAVPGRDIREGLKEIRAAVTPPGAKTPVSAPREPATARTAPPAAVPAPAPKAPQRRKGASPVTASPDRDTAPGAIPAAVFAPGLESGPEGCLHPQVRVKGVCPDCSEWVGGKR